ncbi:MAG TPA: hypothetical protein VJ397_08260 [Thermoplasmata archaeon]|nr:hypothetical protein [Thermoplasmata archaeon]
MIASFPFIDGGGTVPVGDTAYGVARPPATTFVGDFDDTPLDDPAAVFGAVLSRLSDDVTVQPTENYFYIRFTSRGQEFWGNIALHPTTRDQGLLNFVYYDFAGRLGGERSFQYAELGAAEGVQLAKRGDFLYAVTSLGRTVSFHLNRVDQSPLPPSQLRPSEEHLLTIQDESNLQFSLLFDVQTNHFLYVLREPFRPLEATRSFGEGVLIETLSGFAFYEDPDAGGRKVLIGAAAENVYANTYYDGPFDQIAENYIRPESAFSEYVQRAYPETRGLIDRYGIFPGGAAAGRVVIMPYSIYTSPGDLVRRISSCRSLPTDWFSACIAQDFQQADPLHVRDTTPTDRRTAIESPAPATPAPPGPLKHFPGSSPFRGYRHKPDTTIVKVLHQPDTTNVETPAGRRHLADTRIVQPTHAADTSVVEIVVAPYHRRDTLVIRPFHAFDTSIVEGPAFPMHRNDTTLFALIHEADTRILEVPVPGIHTPDTDVLSPAHTPDTTFSVYHLADTSVVRLLHQVTTTFDVWAHQADTTFKPVPNPLRHFAPTDIKQLGHAADTTVGYRPLPETHLADTRVGRFLHNADTSIVIVIHEADTSITQQPQGPYHIDDTTVARLIHNDDTTIGVIAAPLEHAANTDVVRWLHRNDTSVFAAGPIAPLQHQADTTVVRPSHGRDTSLVLLRVPTFLHSLDTSVVQVSHRADTTISIQLVLTSIHYPDTTIAFVRLAHIADTTIVSATHRPDTTIRVYTIRRLHLQDTTYVVPVHGRDTSIQTRR